MSLFPQLGRQSRKQWVFMLALLLLGLTLETGETKAQSGRRNAKAASSPSPDPVSTVATGNPTSEGEIPLAPGELPAKVRLLVVRKPTSKHFHTEDQILASFVKQLNRYDNIEATSVGDLKEDQAVERAKAESESYVILLKFDIDSFQSGTIIMNSQDLQIEYSVLAPQTGKKQTKGKVYFQAIGGGRMRKSDWPNGTPIRITPEATGIEAADGLYFWLKLAAMKKVRA
jgi:23S rRNA pseudoU1915 N3-methylase RlmH